jgi:haloalkane dehalogenase
VSPAEFPYDKQTAVIDGKAMAYVDKGEGDPIVFLHGNPTSSYLWRNVIPHVEGLGRVIAPDLIGMGDSDKLDDAGPGSYRFVEHRRYLDGLFDHLGLAGVGNVTFVIHDWGSALGFDWASRHPSAIKGIAYMEAIVRPVDWADWPDAARDIFQAMRSDAGEDMILEKNLFVDAILPSAVLRDLTDDEMAHYRAPFNAPGEGRRPTLTWPREIPAGGEPADVVRIVEDYGSWLARSDVPKLFVNAEPGAILTGPQREFCRSWPNQTEVTVAGNHFIQEDSPDEIGEALADWLRGLA